MAGVAVTGAHGFLGWHTRAALREGNKETATIAVGEHFTLDDATKAVNGASRFIHIAGANRGTDEDIRELNLRFAEQMATAIARADNPPPVVVFANSIQAGNGSVYGEAKARATDILRAAADAVGSRYDDVLLPNLFGEHGRPFYNAVTATFSQLLAQGESPAVKQDKELQLLHAQDAADVLLGTARPEAIRSLQVHETVSGLLARLQGIAAVYGRGEIPDIAARFDRDLFNTYRSYTFPGAAPIRLSRHADARGSFFEIVRAHGGAGQSSFSTTEPGISRGDHFHRRKVERFTVLAGSATIALRRLFTNQVFEFAVTGDEPTAIDMPTMWSHNVTNIGPELLYTSFWANEIFDPEAPDTTAEAVHL